MNDAEQQSTAYNVQIKPLIRRLKNLAAAHGMGVLVLTEFCEGAGHADGVYDPKQHELIDAVNTALADVQRQEAEKN